MLSHPLCGTQLWQPKQSNLRLIPLFSQIFWGGWNPPLTQRDQQSPSSWPCICFRDKHDIWQEPVRLEIFVELLEKKKTPSSFSRVAAQTSFCWLWTGHLHLGHCWQPSGTSLTWCQDQGNKQRYWQKENFSALDQTKLYLQVSVTGTNTLPLLVKSVS